jgi:hypothetical protein
MRDIVFCSVAVPMATARERKGGKVSKACPAREIAESARSECVLPDQLSPEIFASGISSVIQFLMICILF